MKPVVLYNINRRPKIKVGYVVYIYTINHPSLRVSNAIMVATSPVLRKRGVCFETENTVYVGVERDVAHDVRILTNQINEATGERNNEECHY